MVLRQTFPELAPRAGRLIDRADYRLFWDPARGRMRHGYWTQTRTPSRFHYGVFYAEARAPDAARVPLPVRVCLRRVAARELRRDRQGRRPGRALVRDGADVSRRVHVAA